ncbi:MAG: fibro-slime domain-containing protein [Firmicutes bacterium]|nr:fibro-slime domain-containing protein [Bacillota bacterium]
MSKNSKLSEKLQSKKERLLARRRLKNVMMKTAFGMSCLAVFCVVYALVVPALTVEWPPECGTEEHIHTEACYSTVTPVEMKCAVGEGEADVIIHTHDSLCYDGNRKLICQLSEVKAHTHDETCYALVSASDLEAGDDMAVEEGDAAVAEESEPTPMSKTPVCGMEETILHTHTDSCYNDNGDLICSMPQIIAHQHTEACRIAGDAAQGYSCGKEEHIHTDLCRVHKEPEYCCGLEEHTHADECYNEEGEVVCGKIQHAHTDVCETESSAMAIDETYTYETEAITAKFHIVGDAIIPGAAHIAEDAKLEFAAKEAEDQDEYTAYAEELSGDGSVVAVQIFEYTLTYGGYELDLTQCDVTAEIMPTETLIEYSHNAEMMGIMTLELDDDFSDSNIDIDENDFGLLILAGDGESEPQEGVVEEESAVSLKLRSNKVKVGIVETANPKFKVQYYAPLEIIDTDPSRNVGNTALEIIDTDKGTPAGGGDGSGGNLPKNGVLSPTVKNIYVDSTGKIVTVEEMTEIYAEKEFTYLKAPNLKYFNIVTKDTLDSSFELDEVWVLKEGADPESTDENDWTIYLYDTDLKFTNRAAAVTNDRYVLIEEDSVLRLVYKAAEKQYSNPVNFYDYDISDGNIYGSEADARSFTNKKNTSSQTDDETWTNTNQQGIHNPGNYEGTGAKLAFGNANTGTGLGNLSWSNNGKENTLNKANKQNTYKGCTFGIAASLDANGKIQYNSGIIAPNLFNDGPAIGKTNYDNSEYSLTFNRVGDNYTLSAVKGSSLIDLETFKHPGNYTHIWTNNFWPMDSASSYGTDGHDMKFGSGVNKDKRKFAGVDNPSQGSLPPSDDALDHNCYFGMQFALSFELTKDYTGPLEYYFFGDDDMWIFLDGRPIIDIGGLHSATGEYVNLWDYIDKSDLEGLGEDETKTYTLTFFYTERGASGSTCWMNFTLPTVVGVNLEKQLEELNKSECGALWIEKVVDGIVDADAEFEFTLDLFTISDDGTEIPLDDNYGGETLRRDESGAIIKGDKDEVIHSGDTFRLRNGGAMVIYNLPAQIGEGESAKTVYYRVREASSPGYLATHSVVEEVLNHTQGLPGAGNGDSAENVKGETYKGMITANILDKVVYTNHTVYELPNTGGKGTWLYTIGGLLVIGIAASFLYRKKLLQKERVTH